MDRDVIAIGDVHGDGDRLIHALERLQLATGGFDGARWIGGSVSLVLMGDVLDGAVRSDDPSLSYRSSVGDLQLVEYLDRLTKSAKANGGEVTCLKGNHEVMNEVGFFQYVHPRDKVAGRQRRIVTSPFMKTWKRAHSENRTLFTHAGVNPERANYVSDLDDVLKLQDHDVMEHRGYADDERRPDVLERVRAMLRRGDWDQMVIGHNTVDAPQTTWDGMVVMADAKLSRAYGNSTHIHVLCVRPWGEWIPIHIPLV
jgi:hypothetical protein